MLYLLQLVQALKYEKFEDMQCHSLEVPLDAENLPTSRKISIEDSGESGGKPIKYNIQVFLHSKLNFDMIKRELKRSSSSLSSDSASTASASVARTSSLMDSMTLEEAVIEPIKPNLELNMDLTTFLIHRACINSTLANYFFWFVPTTT